jgi:hypothetical protein
MAETTPDDDREPWKGFLRRHWVMLVLFAVGAVLAAIGAVLVYLWFVGDAQATGLVPPTLNLWTLGDCVNFVLYLILWEVLFIAIPLAIAAVAGWLWWKRLPDEEKKEYHFLGGRSRATNGGGLISLLVFVAFCIKIFTDGRWSVPLSTWTVNYLVYSLVAVFIWILVIFGIPVALGAIWWIRREMRKP